MPGDPNRVRVHRARSIIAAAMRTLGDRPPTVRNIAERAGYTTRHTRNTLADMIAAGDVTRTDHHPKRYALTD